jgi:hypothetical protein
MTWAEKIPAVAIPQRRCHCGTPRLARPVRKLKQITSVAAALLLLAFAATVRAGCDEDCKGEYLSSLGECRTHYEQGDRNVQELELCLADTRGEYDDCIDDCTALGAGGVVAGVSPGRLVTTVISSRR